ncbi:hypothetical protein M413DRAFT_9168 [Hebeloma cylindrosporum]|uniref:F-box domain-containing protein n=1 Tax=Hebeloma cylindrosporum TaxID=76867 RepID=A0A0C2YVB4_HEBCY|nr:hypothetical protein M413DRAFT_9168 [Hebeloma cylindrosporum h7]
MSADDYNPGEVLDLSTVMGRRLYNSQAAISMLHEDILSRVFLVNSHMDFHHPHCPSQTSRRTAQVFHKWRVFSLSFPMMWATSLDFADPLAWVYEAVRRAGPVPLNIIFPPFPISLPNIVNIDQLTPQFYIHHVQSMMKMQNATDSSSKLAVALSLVPRSHTFIAKIHPSSWEYLLKNLCRSPMLSLHTLSLGIEKGESDAQFTLPTTLFNDYTPHLKNLTLYGCIADISSPIFRTLTTLSISQPGFQSALAPARWLEVLSALRELEYLMLTYAFLDFSNIDWDIPDHPIFDMDTTLPVVELTRLKYLKLVGDLEPCTQLFINLRLPPSCGMDIECHSSRANDVYRDMTFNLQRQLGAREDGGRNLVESIRLSTNRSKLGFKNKSPGLEGDETLSLYWFPSFSTHADGLSLFLPAFSSIISIISPGVVDMEPDFQGYNPLTDSQIIQVFLPFTNLQSLYIRENRTLDRLLLVFNNYDERHESVLLPALRLLSLEYLFFGNQPVNPRYSDLLHFLRRRSETGFPISTIKLRQCGGFLEADVKQLGISIDWGA